MDGTFSKPLDQECRTAFQQVLKPGIRGKGSSKAIQLGLCSVKGLNQADRSVSPSFSMVMEQTFTAWMQRLLRQADRAGDSGEVPVAAVILDPEGRAIGWGVNQRERQQDPLGHAELLALRQAARLRGDWRFNGHTLLVTLEPCPMCAGALVQARMGRVIYGARDPKRGALGSCLNLARSDSAHHHMDVVGGLLEKECKEQLQSWFRQRRQSDGMQAIPAP